MQQFIPQGAILGEILGEILEDSSRVVTLLNNPKKYSFVIQDLNLIF
jgi:hypothetical protein